jgi:hypothetical protein
MKGNARSTAHYTEAISPDSTFPITFSDINIEIRADMFIGVLIHFGHGCASERTFE